MPVVPTASSLERERELEVLTSVTTALNGSVSLADALSTALSQVAEVLHLNTGWIWLLDEGTGRPYLAASQNLPAALRNHPEWMEGRWLGLTELQKGESCAAGDVLAFAPPAWLTDGTAGLRFHASVPLHARGERVGAMNVASTGWRELSSEEHRLLHVVGDMLGLGIERSRLYARCAVSGAVEERNRLAREIHDTLAQGLAATALQLETADALLEAGAEPERVRNAVRRALDSTRQNLEDARRSVLDLRPRPLEDRSLATALRALCEERNGEARPKVTFRLHGEDRALPSAVEAGLYRVAQEAIANAVRHADASTICVELTLDGSRAVLQIDDDGRGFAAGLCEGAEQTERTNGFGLVGMCERVRLLGGQFNVQSSPGEGSRIRVELPLG